MGGVTLIDAYCENSHPQITDDGNMICVYAGQTMEIGTNKQFTDQCMRCSCTPNGLSCCGLGTRAGIMKIDVPTDCHLINCKCKARLVKKADNYTACDGSEVIDICRQEYGVIMTPY